MDKLVPHGRKTENENSLSQSTQSGKAATKGIFITEARRHRESQNQRKTRAHGGGGGHGAVGWRHGGVGTGIRRCSHRQSTGPNPLFMRLRLCAKKESC